MDAKEKNVNVSKMQLCNSILELLGELLATISWEPIIMCLHSKM